MKRRSRLYTFVNDEENIFIRQNAELCNLSVSQYLRACATETRLREIPPFDFFKLYSSLCDLTNESKDEKVLCVLNEILKILEKEFLDCEDSTWQH